MTFLLSLLGALSFILCILCSIDMRLTTTDYIKAMEESKAGKDRYGYILELKKQFFEQCTLLSFFLSVAIIAFLSIGQLKLF